MQISRRCAGRNSSAFCSPGRSENTNNYHRMFQIPRPASGSRGLYVIERTRKYDCILYIYWGSQKVGRTDQFRFVTVAVMFQRALWHKGWDIGHGTKRWIHALLASGCIYLYQWIQESDPEDRCIQRDQERWERCIYLIMKQSPRIFWDIPDHSIDIVSFLHSSSCCSIFSASSFFSISSMIFSAILRIVDLYEHTMLSMLIYLRKVPQLGCSQQDIVPTLLLSQLLGKPRKNGWEDKDVQLFDKPSSSLTAATCQEFNTIDAFAYSWARSL